MFSPRFARWVTGASLLALATVSCKDELLQPSAEDGGKAPPAAPSFAITARPPGASVSVPVEVPGSMRSAPFDIQRTLRVPPDFRISVYARVSKPRFMAVTPDGNLLVSQPGTGKVLLVRPNPNGDPTVSDWATGLYRPHDIVFHAIGGTTYVYLAEGDKIARYTYASGDLTGKARQVIISGLPSASSPELNGSYGHELKNIALDGNHKLYVSIASTCNACVSDTRADPVRGSIYQYNADGTGGRLFARGLRNAEGLALVPGTNTLWVSVNNRDRIAYPFHKDWNGDGSDDYGKVMQSYVDNHPPEEFTRVRDGGNYGWPFCNPNPDTPNGFDDMPFDRDVQYNADGTRLNCDTADRISKGIQAHSAPLGLLFLQNTRFPDAYRAGAAIAYHGSWNRSVKTGYKVAFFPWDGGSQRPGEQIDLVTGWADASSSWGRPVDVAVDARGSMFISDDQAGAIYRLTYTPPATLPSPWASRDVGSVAAAGSVAFADDTFTVQGSGADIWAGADEFHFAYQPFTGDGEVVARVASQARTDPWAKAGIMIRDGLGAGARHALLAATPSNGVAFQRRTVTGGSTTHTAGGSGAVPVWVRLVRRGDTFAAHRSADGRTWTSIGSATVPMGSTVYAGLAVTAHNDGQLGAATFDNVRITRAPAWQSRDVGAVAAVGSFRLENGTFTIAGSGSDIWGTSDEFRFTHRALDGDGEIVARVASQGNTDSWAKAGVMIREGLGANARHAMVVVSPGNGVAFQRRSSSGGSSTHTAGGSGTAPVWVRLVRTGSTLFAYRSADGRTWTAIGSSPITMSATAYIGLAVTSHRDGRLSTATFDNVRLIP